MGRGKRRFTHVDCFSGAGGITTGFRAAGIETLLAIDSIASCVETFGANHSNVIMVHKDIRDVTRHDLSDIIGTEIDILTAGMPCETFSTAGSKSRSFYDSRQVLYREAIRIADTLDAKVILFENVPGITTKRIAKGSEKLVIDEIFDELADSNYRYHVDTILNSADFGVPQLRERYFILASREDRGLRFPVSKTNNRVSVEQALKGLPLLEAGVEHTSVEYTEDSSEYSELMRNSEFWNTNSCSTQLTYHIVPKHRTGTVERFSYIKPGEGLRDLFLKLDPNAIADLQGRRVLPKKWYIQRNRRLQHDKPSVTVTSHCLDELVHPLLNRALTVREVARLQSFPDHYDFRGGPILCPHIYETQDKYEQIGDAVPPLLAYALGLTVMSILED